MTLEIGFLFAVIVAMVYLFLTEKLPIDLTAFLALVILLLTGYLQADEAFAGFASRGTLTDADADELALVVRFVRGLPADRRAELARRHLAAGPPALLEVLRLDDIYLSADSATHLVRTLHARDYYLPSGHRWGWDPFWFQGYVPFLLYPHLTYVFLALVDAGGQRQWPLDGRDDIADADCCCAAAEAVPAGGATLCGQQIRLREHFQQLGHRGLGQHQILRQARGGRRLVVGERELGQQNHGVVSEARELHE